MSKKRILVCDDNQQQYRTLERILTKRNYEVLWSTDYTNVIHDLERLAPVHLLILDLGFPQGMYVGQDCVPDVLRLFPNIKIIIRSDILTHKQHLPKATEILRGLVRYPQVAAFLSSTDKEPIVEFEVGKALGTSDWLLDGEVWILHISDPQFGGDGLPWGLLAERVIQTLHTFVKPDDHHLGSDSHNYPSLTVLTGDLTEHGRPEEFEMASRFSERLAELMATHRPELRGVMGNHNVVVLPGNHDINWDISFARNLHRVKQSDSKRPMRSTLPMQYKKEPRTDIDFIRRYSWLPFTDMKFGLPEDASQWAWDPGYYIINLREELRLILVCLNSSKWGVDHMTQRPEVPSPVWEEIQSQLQRFDPQKQAARILLVHHTLSEDADFKDRLCLAESPDERKLLIDVLSRSCNFCGVLTGHYHQHSVDNIDTGSDSRTLIHIGAGTVRSDDRRKYRNPQFNLIKLGDLSADTDKFQSITVYPFLYDGTRFFPYPAFEDGKKTSRQYSLRY